MYGSENEAAISRSSLRKKTHLNVRKNIIIVIIIKLFVVSVNTFYVISSFINIMYN